MKTTKLFHAEAIEILNKPGRYAILTQWVAGGAINHDNAADGQGYTLEQATKKLVELRAMVMGTASRCQRCQNTNATRKATR